MLNRILLVTFATIMMYGCYAPQAIYKLTVADPQYVTWRFGYENVTMNFDGLYLEASYIESYEEYHVFFVSIINESRYKVMVEPSNFYYTIDEIQYSPGAKPKIILGDIVAAVDPEQRILEIESKISKEIADDKNMLTRQILSEIVIIAADAVVTASSDEDDDFKYERMANRQASRLEMYRSERGNRAILIESMADRKRFWSVEVLRKTTLFPGYEVGGYVFFPRKKYAEKLTANFKIEGIDYLISYRQIEHLP